MKHLRITCPAKINLGLAVTDRRTDGYHDVETYLATVSVGDRLIIEPDRRLQLSIRGVGGLPADRRNLVYRAAELFGKTAGVDNAVAIQLIKRIPPGTGLGGGSSDAAGALVGLNEYHGGPLEHSELERLAAELGSDVPFFLRGGVAFAHGRGELLEPLSCPREQHLVLALPQATVSTSWAYKQLTEEDFGPLEREPIENWLSGGAPPTELFNVFSAPVGGTFPVIQECLELLRSVGLVAVTLTGSGAACFGLAENADQAARCARELETRGQAAIPARIIADAVTVKED